MQQFKVIGLAHMHDSISKYAAFLRGINVGGNRVLKMTDIKKGFESLGFREVITVGASGNIVFTAQTADSSDLAKTIDTGLHKAFGLNGSATVRSVDHLRELIESDPFRGVKITVDIRLYVTFLNTPSRRRNPIKLPYNASKGIFQILKLTKTEIFTVVDLAAGGGTLDAMGFIEKEFGKNLTTRNWNTVKKLALTALDRATAF
ncbi:MAG TPA: DUF1697 domain-containing protein [Verrucomicrobiae bacterium]|nr:DUF1697 domain-containing protein [Verrucomicrobiae bacterium]